MDTLHTGIYHRWDMEGYHRNLALDMDVNLCKLQEASPPIAWMICQIRTRYKAPGTGSLTKYAFLVDTTRIISVHVFFILWPVLLLPLAK